MSDSPPAAAAQPATHSQPHSATEVANSDAQPQEDPRIHQLAHQIYRNLLSSICLDLTLRVHRRHHTQHWTAAAPPAAAAAPAAAAPTATITTSVSSNDLSVKKARKDPSLQSLRCLHCGRSTAITKYAPHLEKCMGKGGRQSRRRAVEGMSHAATAVALQRPPALPQHDVPVQVAANGHATTQPQLQQRPAPLTNIHANRPEVTIEPPTSLSNSSSAQSSPTATRYTPSHAYNTPMSHDANSTPTHHQQQSHIRNPSMDSVGSAPQSAPRKRGKRSSASLPGAPWVQPLPHPLPTNASLYGLCYIVPEGEQPSGSAPTVEQLNELLSNICCVPAKDGMKLCSNGQKCQTHTVEQRADVRQRIWSGNAQVRFRRVESPAQRRERQKVEQAMSGDAGAPVPQFSSAHNMHAMPS